MYYIYEIGISRSGKSKEATINDALNEIKAVIESIIQKGKKVLMEQERCVWGFIFIDLLANENQKSLFNLVRTIRSLHDYLRLSTTSHDFSRVFTREK